MAQIPASENEFPLVTFAEGAAPSTPAAGLVVCYVKSDGLLYCKDDAGTETAYGAAVSGLAAHLADAADAHDASAISVLDTAAVFTGTDVEVVLKELYDAIAGGGAPVGSAFVAYQSDAGLSAERVVTTPASGGNIAYLVRKTADETVNNSSALQNDDHLLYALAASEEIAFEADLWFESGATPDIKVAFTVPASAAIKWAAYGIDTGSVVLHGSVIIAASGTAQDVAGSATPQRHIYIRGMVINSTNAGNLQLQWAQNTANASDTKMLKNSMLRVWKLA